MLNFDWKKLSLYAAVFVGMVAIFTAYFANRSSDTQTHAAQQAFDRWKQSPTDPDLEKKMHNALARAPQLKQALRAEIAQTLLSAGLTEASEVAAQDSLRLLEKESPFHASFAHTTFLIEKKQYQAALEQATSLKEKLVPTKHRSILYAYNLLRIALLQKQLANGSGELAAWKEIKSLLESQEPKSDAAQLLEANFQKRSGKKSFSLSDFIAQREKALAAH